MLQIGWLSEMGTDNRSSQRHIRTAVLKKLKKMVLIYNFSFQKSEN